MKRSQTCGACGINPVRAYGQRYCKDCHKEAVRKSRIAKKLQIEEMADELVRLRRQIEAMRSS